MDCVTRNCQSTQTLVLQFKDDYGRGVVGGICGGRLIVWNLLRQIVDWLNQNKMGERGGGEKILAIVSFF